MSNVKYYLTRISELEEALAELRKEIEASQLNFEVGDELTDGKFWGIYVGEGNGKISVIHPDGSRGEWDKDE